MFGYHERFDFKHAGEHKFIKEINIKCELCGPFVSYKLEAN